MFISSWNAYVSDHLPDINRLEVHIFQKHTIYNSSSQPGTVLKKIN